MLSCCLVLREHAGGGVIEGKDILSTFHTTSYVHRIRVAKCHGQDGYICVKIFAGWGNFLGEHAIWQN